MRTIILITCTLFFSLNATASSNFNLKINNLGIGDSLLSEYSKSKIKSEIKRNIDFYSVYDIDNTFVELFFYSKLKDYEYISFYIKPNDPNYIIYGLSGLKNYQNKFDKCLIHLDKEIKKFSNYDNLTRYETFEGEHPIDPSGKSFVIQTFFETQAREIVELQCADFDSSVQKNGDNEDYYGIYIFTEEVEDWFAGY